MKTESPPLTFQEAATHRCPEPGQISPRHPNYFWRYTSLLSFHNEPRCPICLFPSAFPTKILYVSLASPKWANASPILFFLI